MTDTLTNIGSELYVSTSAPATEDQSGYEALTWIEVLGVASIGEIGASHSMLNHTDLKTGNVQKAHGDKNNGDPAIQYRVIEADAGQLALKSALDSLSELSFKFVRASGLSQYSQGLVSGAPTNEASSANVYAKSSTLALNKSIVEVAV